MTIDEGAKDVTGDGAHRDRKKFGGYRRCGALNCVEGIEDVFNIGE